MSYADDLRKMASKVAAEIDKNPSPNWAKVWLDYRKELARVEEADEQPKGDVIDEIAARRAARGGATSRLGQAVRSAR